MCPTRRALAPGLDEGVTVTEDAVRLLRDRGHVWPSIGDRIRLGDELLAEAAEIRDEESLDDHGDRYRSWNEYNRTLLERCFSGPIASEYDPPAIIGVYLADEPLGSRTQTRRVGRGAVRQRAACRLQRGEGYTEPVPRKVQRRAHGGPSGPAMVQNRSKSTFAASAIGRLLADGLRQKTADSLRFACRLDQIWTGIPHASL